MLFSARGFKTSGSAYYLRVLADGAVGYWQLGDLTGTVLTDSGPHGYNGAYAGSYTQGQTGIVGAGTNKALLLPGTGTAHSTIALTSRPQIDLTSNFTVECWVKTTAPSQNTLVFGTYNGESNLGHGLGVVDNLMFVSTNGASPLVVSVPSITNGNYHHLVATYTGGSATIAPRAYFDGALVGSQTDRSITSLVELAVGAYAHGLPQIFIGTLDECAIYPTVLSAATILDHYNLGIS